MKKTVGEISTGYRKDIEKAVKILRSVGCEEIYLFGSLAEGSERAESDIDLAVRGCPSGMFFHVLGRLLLELEHPIDLVDLDRDRDFARYLEKEGVLIHVL